MYVLAVDPGVSTGVALLNPEGDIVWTLTCQAPYDELGSALRNYPDAELVFEAMPSTRHYQELYLQVINVTIGDPREVQVIRPSEWKSHPFCKVTGSFKTKHEAEAVGIGRGHLLRRKRVTTSTGAGSDREHQKSSGRLSNRAGSIQDL